MGLSYKSLDEITISKMLEEFNLDITNENVYYSKRFTEDGEKYYKNEMSNHLLKGSDDSLSDALKKANCFKAQEERKTARGVSLVKVPETASQTFSEGEYNRFYIRALCLRAIEEARKICVYRARYSENPRKESESLIGQYLDPNKLLLDLRNNIGLDTSLGLPQGPNSGLTIELI
ncbi:MAG: hypothetical protein ABI402_19035 [Ferruginibacter sp.]